MPTTSRGYRYPASSASPNVPADIQNLASDLNTDVGNVEKYTMRVVTSSTRPSSPAEGWHIYETDTDRIMVYNGSSWQHLAYVPGHLFARKTADETVNNSTTLQNDDDLVVTPTINCVYIVEACLFYISPTAQDLKLAWTHPTGSTLSWHAAALASTSASSAGDIDAFARTRDASGTSSTYGGGGANDTGLIIKGLLVMSSTAGNLQLQWAQASAAVADTKVLTDSWMRLVRVA